MCNATSPQSNHHQSAKQQSDESVNTTVVHSSSAACMSAGSLQSQLEVQNTDHLHRGYHRDRSWARNLLLDINILLSVPMYSMLICMWVYVGVAWAAYRWSLNHEYPLWLYGLVLLYVPYIVYDTFPQKGNFSQKLRSVLRSWIQFKWVAEYFDMQLVKTKDLSASDGPYVFAYHPHGIIALGCNAALNTNGCNFEQVFPGIKRASVTLQACFWAPLFRDWMLGLGFITAHKSTLMNVLLDQDESLVIIPGGAAEALECKPRTMRLTLKNRKGFVKLALEAGAKVVPCLGFGENDLWDTLVPQPSSKMWEYQQKAKKMLSFSTPIMMHVLPNKRRVTVVVGEPVVFPPMPKQEAGASSLPAEYVDACHTAYLEALTKLYEENKAIAGYEDVPLEII